MVCSQGSSQCIASWGTNIAPKTLVYMFFANPVRVVFALTPNYNIKKEQYSQYDTWKRKQSDITVSASASASSQKGPKSALLLPLLYH